MRARSLASPDPVLELSIGLACLHRAMQRQADNRHILILQGMTFIFNYYRLVNAQSWKFPGIAGLSMRQEAEYNVGRAFHQLGLLSLATPYYERVLRISEGSRTLGWDLVFESAHNLSLIYFLGGNYGAAREVT